MARRIAVAQMTSTASMEENLRQASDLISQARLSHASFVTLPEAFDYLVDDPNHSISLASSLHSNPVLSRYHAMACQADLWLSLGGMHVLAPHDPTRLHSVHLILSPHDPTTPVAAYRKTHLDFVTSSFGAAPPSSVLTPSSYHQSHHIFQHQPQQPSVPEAYSTLAGDSLVVAYDTPVGNVGLSIGVADLYQPSLFAALREANAHVLLTPAVVPAGLGGLQWSHLVHSRAIENQCFVAAAAQTGTHSHVRPESYGHSMIVDPTGKLLGDAGRMGSGLLCADINLDLVHQVRDKLPIRKSRRDDLLGKIPRAGPV